MTRISVIIPVYNAGKYLRNCLNSLLGQSFQDFEVIIVNDGSKDASRDICEEYKRKDTRIKVIHQENQGVSKARNVAIREAQGEWLFFLDADDELFKESLETLYNHTKETDLVIGECVVYSTNGGIIFKPQKTFVRQFDQNNSFQLLYRPYFIYQGYLWNKLYKNSIFIDNSIKFNEKISFGEDKLLIIEYLSHCKSATYTSQAIYKYFRREDSAMSSISRSFNYKYISSFYAEVESYNIILGIKDIKNKIKRCAQESVVTSYLDIVSRMKRFSATDKNKIKELEKVMNDNVPKLSYYRYFIKAYSVRYKNKIKSTMGKLVSKTLKKK